MTRLAICGACGRMGRRIVACASGEKEFRIVGAVEREGHAGIGRDVGEIAGLGRIGVEVSADLESEMSEADVIVDFSERAASARHARLAAAAGKPIVIGTTGLDHEEMAAVRKAAEKTACLIAPNMSVGVNVLFRLAGEVARSLGEEYDVEIIETHHRFKKDAPSGTAKRLAKRIAGSLGRDLSRDAVYGRVGETGERPRGEIGIHAVRQGDIVGEHVVSFAGAGERLELVHKAHSRDTFARGALRAARWIVRRPPGLYDMEDVLRLRRERPSDNLEGGTKR